MSSEEKKRKEKCSEALFNGFISSFLFPPNPF
jgi:hypothetical protein